MNANNPSVLPVIALQDHDYIIDDVGYEKTSLKTCNKSIDQNQVLASSTPQQCDRNQSAVPPAVNKSSCTSSCSANVNSTGMSSFFKYSDPPGSFSICVPVSQSEIKFLVNAEISLCLLNQTGESSSLLTPGWKDGQSKCAKKVKNLIEDFDKHIKNPLYNFSVMEKYIVEIFKIAGMSTTKNPLNPLKILIEPCILSLRAITKIYKAGNDFSIPASKYYFMFLLDRFRFIRNEVTKIQSIQTQHN